MKVFKPTPAFLYINREKWLREMNLNGWKLINYSWWTYEFEKSSPNDLYFFLYETSVKNDKPYWVYYDVMSKYSYKKSKINVKGLKEILVIKPERIDDEFWTYMNIRDKYVLREIILSIVLFSIFTILGIVIMLLGGLLQGILSLIFFLPFLIFQIIGLVICKKNDKTKEYRYKNHGMEEIIKKNKRKYRYKI